MVITILSVCNIPHPLLDRKIFQVFFLQHLGLSVPLKNLTSERCLACTIGPKSLSQPD